MSGATKLSDFRDHKEYKDLLLDMLLVYARSEQFNGLSSQERIQNIDKIEELVTFIDNE